MPYPHILYRVRPKERGRYSKPECPACGNRLGREMNVDESQNLVCNANRPGKVSWDEPCNEIISKPPYQILILKGPKKEGFKWEVAYDGKAHSH